MAVYRDRIRLAAGATGYVLGFASAIVVFELIALYGRLLWGVG